MAPKEKITLLKLIEQTYLVSREITKSATKGQSFRQRAKIYQGDHENKSLHIGKIHSKTIDGIWYVDSMSTLSSENLQ